jgi:hydrogenase/urease accessory protein HupE
VVAALGVAALALALTSLFASRAEAHTVGLSTGEYTARRDGVRVKLAFARGELAAVLPALDANRDGHVTALEVEAAKKALAGEVLGRILVTSGVAPCAPVLLGAGLTEEDGLTLEGRFDCATREPPYAVDVALLDTLPDGHRHVARAVGATTEDALLVRGHATFTLAPPAEAAPSAPASSPSSGARDGVRPGDGSLGAGGARDGVGASAWGFFKLGIEHILTGYDHLVFLFGLVLLRARLKELVGVVTAFTLAHSLTLAVAVLGIVVPSPRFVEPAIALSIAYVGVENLVVKDSKHRWRIAFPFGLLHGFGFAGVLREIHLPRAAIPGALVAFNVGVEAGQLFAMMLVVPMVMLVRDQAWFEPRGVRVLSAAVAFAGCVWFVLRVASG